MIRLAIDASTPVCAVGLVNDVTQQSAKRWEKGQGVHSERLFGQISEVLAELSVSLSDVDEFILTSGPGSYTGLRIAASALKGLLFGTSHSITEVQTLAYIVASGLEIYPEATRFHALIDARRTHLYHQLFEIENGKLTAIMPLEIRDLQHISNLILPHDFIGGTGIDRLILTDEQKVTCTRLTEEEALNPLILAQFSTKNDSWNPFYTKVNPALFEPNYYTSGHAQVHQSVTS